MSDTPPERPTMPDDLDQAYAKAHAVADAARGPSAAVRANVLAAAREIAAQAAVRSDGASAPPAALTPVAPPMAAVGRGRMPAVNLASWRVRAGAALCAALLVGVAGWRIDASRHFGADTQLAAAAPDTLEVKALPPPQVALDLPPPPQASVPASPVDGATMANAASPEAAAKPAARAKDLVVAQAEPPLRERARSLAQDDLRAQKHTAPPIAPLPAPVVVASVAPAPVAPQIRTTSVMPSPAAPAPMVPEPPRVAFAAAAPAREQTAGAAASDAQRVEITGSSIARSAPVGDAARVALDSAKRSAPAAAGSLFAASARQLPTPLQTAADHGDVETLKTLLADPATLVDAPDATGRTALLHAVLAQQVAAVRLLIAAGADPGHADQAGLTPRAAALAGANAEIAALLDTPR